MKPYKTNSDDGIDLKWMVRALRHRNYRLFFAGQGISLIGTWMQRIAMGWLVYRLTNSAFLLGLVGFTGQLPIFLLTPFAGVLADRLNRHRMLVVTQTLAMMQALALALLILTGTIAVWHIVSLSIFLGFVDALDLPVRQSFLVEMIEKREDLGNAIALNSSIVNSARLIGPSIAGILIAYVGEGVCFLLNAISYLAVIASLLAMKIVARRIETPKTDIFQGVKEGFSYAFGFAPIRSVLLLISLVSLLGGSLASKIGAPNTLLIGGASCVLGALLFARRLPSMTNVIRSTYARKGIVPEG